MVNLYDNNPEPTQSPFLFSLSRPVNLFDQQLQKTKDFILKLSSPATFEFLEPFESSHAKNNVGKVTLTKSNIRQKPYSLAKPVIENESINSSSSSSNSSNGSTYHQTAILARLSSISSTFKSIFVRPKHTKHIELDKIKNKNPQTTKPTEFKLKLFSTGDEVSIENKLDEKIEKIISKNIETYTKPSSCSSSIVSTLSTTSNLTNDSFLTKPLEAKPVIKSSNTQSKWTCMICLSKHKLEVKVCSICGSMRQNLKLPHKPQSNPTTLKTINSNTNQSYLKTWTCNFCSFANDSLKVVCMNCRSSKQQQKVNNDKVLLHQTVQKKRKEIKLNTSNEENEFEQKQVVKKTKIDEDFPKCCNCKNDKKVDETLTNKNLSIYNQNTQLVTPTKPSNFYDSTDAAKKWVCSTCLVSNDLNKKQCVCCMTERVGEKKPEAVKKWTCSACLVSNDDDKQTCVCCMTPRVVENKKWSCTVCLVSNESDKQSCVCCMTPRDGKANDKNDKTKFSELVEAAKTLNPLNSVNTSISFGVKSSDDKPITFSSNFGNDKPVGMFSFGTNPDQPKPVISFGTSFGVEAKPEETPKQVETEKPTFGFGITQEPKPVETPKPTLSFGGFAETKPSEAPKPLFGFGSSNTQETKPVETPKPTLSFGGFGSQSTEPAKPLFGFASTTQETKPVETPSFTFGSSTVESKPVEAVKPTFGFGGFGNTESKAAFGFGGSNTQETKPVETPNIFSFGGSTEKKPAETPKPAFSFGGSSVQESKPVETPKPAFSFGGSSVQESKPVETPKTGFNFGGSENKPSSSFFGSSSTQSSSFGFGQQEPVKPAFGFGQTNEAPKPAFGFGTSNPEPAKPSFNFGSNQSTFAFGGKSEQPVETPKPFNFGNSNASSFNFGASSNPFGGNDFCSTPTTKPAFGQATPSTQASSTPFVFGGLQQNNVDSPSLTQVLGAQTTPSTRAIKKPTRRLKK